MHYKKIYKNIVSIERKYKQLKKELYKQTLLKAKKNHYFKKDKEEFKKFWYKYINFFEQLKQLLKYTRYRKLLFFIDYNKLVLRKYIIHFYYYAITDLIYAFGENEEFIRLFLNENFKKDYGFYSKYIYKPKYINIYNTPSIFIKAFKNFIDKKIFKLLSEIREVKGIKRIESDSVNFFYGIKYGFDKILFVIIKYFGNIIAHIRFTKRNYGLIQKDNLSKYLEIANPGDILLTRGNWNASNISIPGFWKHMSMYLGNGGYIKKYFKGEEIKKLDNDLHYIIEATSLGINIVSIGDLVKLNDYLGVFRTNFSKEKIEKSINNTLNNLGKSYDFIFNYHSDKRFVCSALILKSYAKENEKDEGIDIELEKISIGIAYPPNNFIKKVIEETKTTKELKGVFFIDSIERTGQNFVNTIEELLKSGNRSRFTIYLK